MPVFGAGASGDANGAGGVEGLEEFGSHARDGDFADAFGGKVHGRRAVGLVHFFDLVEIVVGGAAEIAADGERLNAVFGGAVECAVDGLNSGKEFAGREIVAAVDGFGIDGVARVMAFEADGAGINPFEVEVGFRGSAGGEGDSGLGRQHVAGIGANGVGAGSEDFGGVGTVLIGARGAAGIAGLGSVGDARAFDGSAVVIEYGALDGAGGDGFGGFLGARGSGCDEGEGNEKSKKNGRRPPTAQAKPMGQSATPLIRIGPGETILRVRS